MFVLPIPAPCKVMFFEMFRLDQDHEPSGQTRTSPVYAPLIALLTVVWEQSERLFVAADATTAQVKITIITTLRITTNLLIFKKSPLFSTIRSHVWKIAPLMHKSDRSPNIWIRPYVVKTSKQPATYLFILFVFLWILLRPKRILQRPNRPNVKNNYLHYMDSMRQMLCPHTANGKLPNQKSFFVFAANTYISDLYFTPTQIVIMYSAKQSRNYWCRNRTIPVV